MTSIGSDEPRYIQPFDHRQSFETKMFGWIGALSPDQLRLFLSGRADPMSPPPPQTRPRPDGLPL
jgi:hypothetical protein